MREKRDPFMKISVIGNYPSYLVVIIRPEPRKEEIAVTANERRAEIIRILTARRSETTKRLADELRVSPRTIRTDIALLTADYPLETQRGNGGCVKLADWYHPHKNVFSKEQQHVLSQLIGVADEHQANVLYQMLIEFGSPQYRQKKG